MNDHHRLNEKWLRAAAIGSLWASIEIVIGSFLHNIRFPLAGTILSVMSVGLMVSFLRIWPMKGIIWRAGVIAALMKSLSPSAVILGPMTGIMLEAFLMEAFIRTVGINRPGVILGAMAGVFSALVHKVVNLLILYGQDLASLFDQLVRFASKQLGFINLGGWELILFLGGLYLAAGAIAGWLGWSIAGRHAASPVTPVEASTGYQQNRLFAYTDPQRFSALFLVVHLAGITFVMLAMNRFDALLWIPVALSYLIFTLVRYRRSLRQLMKPRLWIQLILITLLAAMFLKGIESGRFFDLQGLTAGLMMNIRAIVLLSGFAAVGVELKNPVIKSVLYRRGFASLYHALSLSFTLLPDLLAHWEIRRGEWRALRTIIPKMLNLADSSYERILDIHRNLPPLFIVTGSREEGKTSFLKNLLALCSQQKDQDSGYRGVKLAGFWSEGEHDPAGVRRGYKICACDGSGEVPFCEIAEDSGGEHIGKFRIDEQGLKTGRLWLSTDRVCDSDLVVIDEMGPLELSGRGWAPAVDEIMSVCAKPMLWTVRRSLVEKMARKWTVGQVTLWDVNVIDSEEAYRELSAYFLKQKGQRQ